MMNSLPYLGVGLGFREPLKAEIFLHQADIDLLEITSDHYLDADPGKLAELDLLRDHFALIPHSLDLSLGSAEGVDEDYLAKLAELIDRLSPPWFSDHICFTKAGGNRIGHLAPVPFTDEALSVFVRNIEFVRKKISVPLILENITFDIRFRWSAMGESAFIRRVLEETDCGLLLDVTNLYINSRNHQTDWRQFLDEIPMERVVQIHFVGAHRHAGRLVDAHSHSTEPEIWNVLREVCVRTQIKGAILERDDLFPEFSEHAEELKTARSIVEETCTARGVDLATQPISPIAGLAV